MSRIRGINTNLEKKITHELDKKKVKLKKSKEDWFWGTGRGYSQNVWRGSIFRVIAVLIIIVGLIIYLLIKKFYG